jgi:hypothetical protein
MPSQKSTATIGPDGICSECQQPHVPKYGGRPCQGHVRFERDQASPNYRARLPQPRPCQKPAAPGLTRCHMHGVSSKKARAAGRRRVVEEKAERAMRRFGGPIDTTPTEALLDTVRWCAGYVAWLREKVADTQSDDALVWGATRETDDAVVVGNGPSARVENVTKQTREAGPNAWLALLGEWSDRLVRACAEAIRCGVAERQVRLAESQGKMLADVIRGILGDLRLTAEQEALVGDVVPRHLRAVAG